MGESVSTSLIPAPRAPHGASASVPAPVASSPKSLALAGALMDRFTFSRKIGQPFGGRRDLEQILGYPDDRELTTATYRNVYRRGDIAERIVELYPNDTWGEGFDVIEDLDPEIETEFESKFNDFADRLDLKSILYRADVLCNLGQYSCVLIGVAGNSDLSTPLTSASLDDIIYLKPIADDHAEIESVVNESNNRRFTLPEYYSITLANTDPKTLVNTTSYYQRKVHWTRLLHIADGLLEDDVYGKPRLRSIYNRLQDKDKIIGGGAEAAWRHMDRGLQFDLDKEIQLGPEEKTKFNQAIDAYLLGFDRVLRTKGVTINELGSKMVNFDNNVEALLKIISAATGIPYRILAGSERGELASTQDDANWHNRISTRRQKFAVKVLRDLIDRLIMFGALPTPKNLIVIWPEEEELSEREKSEVVGAIAKANKDQAEAEGVVILSANEIRDMIFSLDPHDPNYAQKLIDIKKQQNDPGEKGSDSNDNNDNGDTPPKSKKAAAMDVPYNPATSRRIVIVGGPRRGKSSLAKSYRDNYGIPTYCTDPMSMVKDVEAGVTYLPEGLDWSASSQYVLDNWLTQLPGPWCIEGIAAVRALRKLVNNGHRIDHSIQIVVLGEDPHVTTTSGQEASHKGVMTVWDEISHNFLNVSIAKSKSKVSLVGATPTPRKVRHTSQSPHKFVLEVY